MRRLILVSQARSGTNWHQDLVGNAPNTLALREIFAPTAVFGLVEEQEAGLKAIRSRLALPDATERSPELVAWFHADPERAISFLEGVARSLGRDAIAFTLFDEQLPRESLAGLMAHPQTRVVILMRRQLARYVSVVKSRMSGRWKHHDTTALRPHIDIGDFAAEAERTESWFRWIAARTRVRTLRYEDDLIGEPDSAFAAVRRASPWLARPTGDLRTRMKRQDRNKDVFDRVANGQALRQELETAGLLERALDYPSLDGTHPPVGIDHGASP